MQILQDFWIAEKVEDESLRSEKMAEAVRWPRVLT